MRPLSLLVSIALSGALVSPSKADLAITPEWALVTADETVQLFAKESSLAQEGRYLRAWFLWDYSSPQPMPDGESFLSQQALKFFDCALRQSSTRVVVLYSGEKATGDVLGITVTFAPERVTEHMRAVVPGSLGELQLNYVCLNAPKPKDAPPK